MLLTGSEILIATKNAGKVKEFESLFRDKGLTVRSLRDYPDIPDIPEDGETFAANALIKARAIALRFGVAVAADDSGLCVDRLDGAPGVYSARYAGEPPDDAANNRKLLDELGKRAAPAQGPAPGGPVYLSPARFVCAIALVDKHGEPVAEVEGECEGVIIDSPRGERGFGYDPLFYVPELGRTLAELTMEEKNALSHRGRALRKLWDMLDRK
ncbi:XTP/dITP diphosphatase [Paenibacillus naphthalenovorans]|uniref:XTP/dITP diphosphatase n=2 Tax=Paenibacillus naphthalenovorans TaxID=162209 RepID=UPI0008807F0C|nr:XTP/dITP diphosphatase [Paenibacillus naphthalenovorans]SDI10468.1 XTP/dITP diphosphohydrolase [Paenibacillus naphthalenovorans]